MSMTEKDFLTIKHQVSKIIDRLIIDEKPYLQNHNFSQTIDFLEQYRREVKSAGLYTPQISKENGGLGLNLFQLGQLYEIFGQAFFGLYIFNCQAPDAGNMEILLEYGTSDQVEQFLNPLLEGKIRSCFSMTEPDNPGSNPTLMNTTAIKDGNDYIINGHKWFTSSADGASFAIVMAITDPNNSNPYLQASQFIVPTNTPGFQIVRNISVMGDEGDGWMSHAEVKYTNCRVPSSFLLGKEGQGFSIAQERLGPGRIHHCMRWIGISERAFHLMCQYATSRKINANQTLADQQLVQSWIADSKVEINAARLLVLDAAKKIDHQGAKEAKIEISMIKFFVANVLQKVLDRAIQLHGALGMTDDTPLALWYRHERAARIYDGPDEVHKLRVAREILKQYS